MPVFFSIGFRPFFALGSLFGGLALLIWSAFWSPEMSAIVTPTLSPFGGFLFWHAHEMIFGFTQAIILGFLLTAVRNWTSLPVTTPNSLIALVCFWVQARLFMLAGVQIDTTYLILSQIITPLLAAVLIAIPIIKKRLWRNLFAPVVLIIFAVLDGYSVFKMTEGHYVEKLFEACVMLVILLVAIIGGRIIPMFSANKLGTPKTQESRVLLLTSVLPIPCLILAFAISNMQFRELILACCALILTLSHSVRLKLWYQSGIWKEPMLWSLFVFYACIPLGSFLWFLSILGDYTQVHLHVFTVGTICGMIVTMMARVSLGHTGRVIKHDALILAVFTLILAAIVLRSILVLALGLEPDLIVYSGAIAGLALILLFIRMIGPWVKPRADAKA